MRIVHIYIHIYKSREYSSMQFLNDLGSASIEKEKLIFQFPPIRRFSRFHLPIRLDLPVHIAVFRRTIPVDFSFTGWLFP